jgi:hypothetical protein
VAILAVDDVWLREPRLLAPGMQPLGLVVAKQEYGGNKAFIALPGTKDSLFNAGNASAVQIYNNFGKRLVVTAATNNWVSNTTVGITGNAPRTILWKGKITALSSGKSLFAYGEGATGKLVELNIYSGPVLIGHFYGSGYDTVTGSPAVSQDIEYVIALTYNGARVVKTFINGALRNTTTLGGDLNTTASKLFVGGAPAAWATSEPCHVDMIAILPICLSDAEIGSFAFDPYQFLIPA